MSLDLPKYLCRDTNCTLKSSCRRFSEGEKEKRYSMNYTQWRGEECNYFLKAEDANDILNDYREQLAEEARERRKEANQ